MNNLEFIDIVTKLLTPILILTIGVYFVMFYRRDREHRNKLEFEKLELEREQMKSNRVAVNIDNNTEPIHTGGVGSGGFIVLDLPENQRGLFHDLLKGFEDFAKLKGYSISFSVDNSISHKIGFKFTINDSGISVSTQKVRNDIKEYMDRIQKGEPLDTLPVLISEEEHSLVLTQMSNRISFLQHNYNLQNNAIKFYEGLLTKLNNSNSGILSQPSVYIQTVGNNQPQNYLATNSPGAIQGNNIHDVESKIRIGETFNEKKNQVEGLINLMELIKKSKDCIENDKIIIKNLEKVKDELEEEEIPDKERIEKWLNKVKSYFCEPQMGQEIIDYSNDVFDSFKPVSV